MGRVRQVDVGGMVYHALNRASSLCRLYEKPRKTHSPLLAADYVADDSPELWDWVIFPHGFHAPKLMSLAKLQAWTLKPAHY